jgi:hypothetical protein
VDYWLLKRRIEEKTDRDRVVGHLEALRDELAGRIPPKDAEDNLLLATWNIRDLGKVNPFGYGQRLPESYFYIAEVLSRFDFVAVQEVSELGDWDRIVDILGSNWTYIASDVTDRNLGGNGERLTYLYDRRKVSFQRIAGEIVLPPALLVSTNVVEKPKDKPADKKLQTRGVGRQFARTPYVASFQAGWFKFDICTVHIYYGEEKGEKLQERISEIRQIAKYFGGRADEALKAQRALILLGDFNVVSPEHETMKALLDAGFQIPQVLRRPTNIAQVNYYDQIAFKIKKGVLDYLDEPVNSPFEHAGAFNEFEHLFTPEQLPEYKETVSKLKSAADRKARAEAKKKGKEPPKATPIEEYYKDWRTWQLSDHWPLWVHLRVNDSGAYLEKRKEGAPLPG